MNSRPLAAQLDICQALRRLSPLPELICLDSAPEGWSYLIAPSQGQDIRQLDDIPPTPCGSADLSRSAWPQALEGGAILQCDYGLPVGQHAAAVAVDQPAGRYARIEAWLAWDPQGRGWIQGDAAACDRLEQALRLPPAPLASLRPRGGLHAPWTADEHCQKVDAIRAAIAAGTCFQANLSIPFSCELVPEANQDIAAFLALRQLSPAPYAFFWRQPRRSICSHSPECFLQGDRHSLRSEPIKGTCRRIPGQEAQQRAALYASSKDRAELAMIIDLVRNDLGRIAVPGTVCVEEAARVMDLDYVHHLVARISAQPHPDTGLQDWLAAAFPPGSITGAPKIEVMRLLQEHEQAPRGPYCGTFGWLGAESCCLAVAIRSLVLQGSEVRYSAGGGIVSDSKPQAEWQEVLDKASRMAAVFGLE